MERSDTCSDPKPSTSWRHAGPSASCSASTLTTHDEPSASSTSPPAKSLCVRPLYFTPQQTPERKFPATRRLRGAGGDATRAFLAASQETSHYTSSLGSLETTSEEPELEQHKPEGTGNPERAFDLERVEHERGESFGPERATSEELEPEKSFLPEPKADESGEDSSDDESEPEPDQDGQNSAHQDVPATVQKLYDSFTGAPQPITQSRTTSGRDAVPLKAPMHAVDVNHIPPEPITHSAKQRRSRNGQIGNARGKSEMDGQLVRQASIRTVLGIAAMKPWRAANKGTTIPVALAEVVNELRFLRQVKGFLTPPIDDNTIIREDNEGTIKMATNRFRSRRTRHVDVKHHVVRDAVEIGIVRIHYVKSGEQHADVLTKALDINTFETHTRFLLNTRAGLTTV